MQTLYDNYNQEVLPDGSNKEYETIRKLIPFDSLLTLCIEGKEASFIYDIHEREHDTNAESAEGAIVITNIVESLYLDVHERIGIVVDGATATQQCVLEPGSAIPSLLGFFGSSAVIPLIKLTDAEQEYPTFAELYPGIGFVKRPAYYKEPEDDFLNRFIYEEVKRI